MHQPITVNQRVSMLAYVFLSIFVLLFNMATESSMGDDQLLKQAYTRVIKPIQEQNRVFCLLCLVKNKHYSAEGLKQHMKAAHPGENLQFEECVADMKKLCIEECKDTLQTFSTRNKGMGMTNFKVSHLGGEDSFLFHAPSHKNACEMLLILLAEKGLLQPHPGPAVEVQVSNDKQTTTYECRSSSQPGKFHILANWVQNNCDQGPIVTPANTLEFIPGSDPNDTRTLPVQDENDILLATLKRVFGYEQFRTGQREIIENILTGKDGVILLPTGGGKTLTFTIPILMSEGVAVLVLPTLPLMQDMYCRLMSLCPCLCISSLSGDDKDSVHQNIMSNNVKIVLVTPESLQNEILLSCLTQIKVSFLVVDEAHCIDEWGLQFRPAYLELGKMRTQIKCQCLAFTATATQRTSDIIMRELRMINPFVVKNSLLRNNLYLHVHTKVTLKKVCEDIGALCKTCLSGQSVIVYCLTPSECKIVCTDLIASGIMCVGYHGDLSPFEKSSNLKKWQNDDIHVIVATKSLCMGINKGSVRSVIHVSFPSSISEYYQQVGRAGRDGNRSDCYLYFKFSDRAIHLDHISKVTDDREKAHASAQLQAFIKMIINSHCIVIEILKYFGEDSNINCQKCSFCLGTIEVNDITDVARHSVLVLQGLTAKKLKVSFNLLTKVMTGSKDKEIKEKQLEQLPMYNCTKMPFKTLERILVVLWCKNIIHEEGRCLCAGPKADDVLTGNAQIMMTSVQL